MQLLSLGTLIFPGFEKLGDVEASNATSEYDSIRAAPATMSQVCILGEMTFAS